MEHSTFALDETPPRIINVSCAMVWRDEVKLKVGSILLFSVYIRYGNEEGPDLLGRALTKSQEITPLRLVGMDNNGHSPYGDRKR